MIWILAALATWRLTHLLHAEDGPFDLLRKLREKLGQGFFGELIDCFYCLSVWVALPFAWLVAGDVRVLLVAWPALSGGAILAERLTASREIVHVPFQEDEEIDDAMLRTTSESPTTE